MKYVARLWKPLFLSALVMVLVGASLVSAQDTPTGEITFWSIQFDGNAIDSVKDIISSFEASHPGTKVNLEVRATDAHKEAMRVAINTSAAPDVYFMWQGIGLGGFYVQSGGVQSLDDYYTKYGWDKRFVPGELAAAKFFGHYYGVPIDVKAMGLYYRKDLFEKAGITAVPTTYDELKAANDKLVAAGITPLSMGGKFNWMTMRLLDSLLEMDCGADKHDQLNALDANWATEACVTAAFTDLRQWVDKGWLPKDFLGIAPDDARIPVFQGQAAMLYDGDWLVPALNDAGEDLNNWDFFPFPTGTKRLSSFGEMLFITNTSKNIPLAAEFVDYWTSPEVQAKHLGVLSSVSPTLGVQAPADQFPLTKKWGDTMAQYAGVYGPADQALPLEIVQSFWKAQNDVISGTTAPEAAGAQVQKDIDQYKATSMATAEATQGS